MSNSTASAASHHPRRSARTGRTLGRLVLTMVAVLATAVGVAQPLPAQAATSSELTITGRGWGHGRGMGQYGAFGYAVDKGWSSAKILNHFYGGTSAGTVPNSAMTVELLALNGKSLTVTAPQLRVNGTSVGAAAVRLTVVGGSVRVEKGSSCTTGTWTRMSGTFAVGSTHVSTPAAANQLGNLLGVCEGSSVRAYRGDLSVISHNGQQMTLNRVPVEAYLRGVVPREVPASWGTAGGGKGMQALQAQSVAARSYALSGVRPGTGATTCDTTTCQVYRGAGVRTGSTWTALEDSRTDTAIKATAGVVRMRAGKPARTEFSSSTGGHTAGGAFTAVPDAGDATASNPNRTWSTKLALSTVASRLGTGAIRSVSVTGRNGLGADGGRVTQVRVVTTGGATQTFTGAAFRSLLGLKSDWFVLSTVDGGEAQKVIGALYQDILGRAPDAAGKATWGSEIERTGDARVVARGIVMSTERLHTFIRAEYRAALKRSPEAAGLTHWTGYMQRGTNVPELQVFIYASDEALLSLGRGDEGRWVDGVYQGILGRSASASERSYWTNVARTQNRPTVVRAIAMSDEAGLRRLNSYYRQMLGRSPDSSGISTYLPLMRGNGDFLLPIEIGGSPEYWSRAQRR